MPAPRFDDELLHRRAQHQLAMETTLLVHGIPKSEAPALNRELARIAIDAGADPALIGVHDGRPVAGMNEDELNDLLRAADVPKLNASNLGVAIHRRTHGATTVSATLRIAHAAGIRVFATGGLGGVHHGYGDRLDISADLAAVARAPVAVVASGVKSILDVVATRELLETLGVPVVGYRTDAFPAFYRRASDADVDARFDDVRDLARYLDAEIRCAGRGVLVANPVPHEDEIPADDWENWLAQAEEDARNAGVGGRDVTPFVLGRLHEISDGRTLRCNLALIRSNVRLGAELAAAMPND